jgi:hypothetical protein
MAAITFLHNSNNFFEEFDYFSFIVDVCRHKFKNQKHFTHSFGFSLPDKSADSLACSTTFLFEPWACILVSPLVGPIEQAIYLFKNSKDKQKIILPDWALGNTRVNILADDDGCWVGTSHTVFSKLLETGTHRFRDPVTETLATDEARIESLDGGAVFCSCRTPAGITYEEEECGVSDHLPVLLREDPDAIDGWKP